MDPHLRELPPAEPDPPPSLDPMESLVLPVVRSRWLVVGALVLGVLGGLVLAVATPNEFTSVGKLLVRVGHREHATPEAALSQDDSRSGPTRREDLENELHLIDNPEVYRRVARRVGPERLLAPYDPTELDDESTSPAVAAFHRLQAWWSREVAGSVLDQEPPPSEEELLRAAVDHIAERTEIASDRNSTVISVRYGTADPELARDVVATLLEEIDRQHRSVFAIDSVLGLVDSAVRAAVEDEAAAREALEEHVEGCGIIDLSTQRSNVLTEISTLRGRVQADGIRRVELESMEEDLAVLLGEQPPMLPAGAAASGPNGVPLVRNPEWEMRARLLLDTRTSLLQLLERFPVTSPEVRGKQRVIDELAADLESIPAMVEAGSAVEMRPGEQPNPTYSRLAERLEEVRLEQSALARAAAERRTLLEEKRAELRELQVCAPVHARLERRLDRASADLASLTDAKRHKEVMQLVDLAEMSNLRVIQSATFPTSKEGPQRVRFLGGGLAIGALVGIALALARRALDPTIRSPRDAERASGVPVLCVVPETARWRRLGRSAGAA